MSISFSGNWARFGSAPANWRSESELWVFFVSQKRQRQRHEKEKDRILSKGNPNLDGDSIQVNELDWAETDPFNQNQSSGIDRNEPEISKWTTLTAIKFIPSIKINHFGKETWTIHTATREVISALTPILFKSMNLIQLLIHPVVHPNEASTAIQQRQNTIPFNYDIQSIFIYKSSCVSSTSWWRFSVVQWNSGRGRDPSLEINRNWIIKARHRDPGDPSHRLADTDFRPTFKTGHLFNDSGHRQAASTEPSTWLNWQILALETRKRKWNGDITHGRVYRRPVTRR